MVDVDVRELPDGDFNALPCCHRLQLVKMAGQFPARMLDILYLFKFVGANQLILRPLFAQGVLIPEKSDASQVTHTMSTVTEQ